MRKFSFWKDMDERKKLISVRVLGALTLCLTVFTICSVFSYFFTWQPDQSLFTEADMLSQSLEVHNMAGKLGVKWGHLLVTRWFGLGAIAIVVMLSVLSLRAVFGKQKFSVIRIVVLSFFAAVLSSYIFAFIGNILGLNTVFASGLGGECGAYVVKYLSNLVGGLMTFVLLVVMGVLWLFFANKRFGNWLTREHESGNVDSTEDGPENTTGDSVVDKDGAGSLGGRDPIEDEEDGEESDTEEDVEVVDVPDDVIDDLEKREAEDLPEDHAGSADEREKSEDVIELYPEEDEVVGNGSDEESVKIEDGSELSTKVTKELPRLDVKDELANYVFPSLDILKEHEDKVHDVSRMELNSNIQKIKNVLGTFKINVEDISVVVGPTVTLYKVYPSPGVTIASIQTRHKEIAMSLRVKSVRIVNVDDYVGIEVPNTSTSIVPLKALLNSEDFRNSKAEIPIAIGYTITKQVKIFDLADAPHLLVAGATKQGKSVGLNVLIASILYSKHPSELKMVFVDPKIVEFTAYARLLKHYLAVLPNAASEEDEKAKAIVKEPKQAADILQSLCVEMDDRYHLLSKAGVNNVVLYNNKYKDRHLLPSEGHKYLPYLVVVIDEYSELTMISSMGESKNMGRQISNSIIRLAQKGRAAGIHVVIATQRPSVDVVTGLIKANFPMRIAFRTASSIDSKTILGTNGAETLIGKGDMLFYAGVDVERVQCAFISNEEINELTKYVESQTGYKKNYNTPYYLPEPVPEQGESGGMIDVSELDERFYEAAEMVVTTQKGSTSDIQRRLGMGYAKAGRVMDQLEAVGIVGPQEGSKPRKVLVSDLNALDEILSAYQK